MAPLIMRAPSCDDASALADLGRSTFVDTFAYLYEREDLDPFLEQVYSPANTLREIADPTIMHRVLERDGQLLGYCKICTTINISYPPELPLPAAGEVLQLSQFYLQPELKGTGAADLMMKWILGKARSSGFRQIILSVYCDNPRAQRFYQRYGFTNVGDTFFMVGKHRDHEFIYRLIL